MDHVIISILNQWSILKQWSILNSRFFFFYSARVASRNSQLTLIIIYFVRALVEPLNSLESLGWEGKRSVKCLLTEQGRLGLLSQGFLEVLLKPHEWNHRKCSFSHNNLIIIRYTSLIIFLLPPCFGKNSPTFLFSFPARHRASHHTRPFQDGPAFGDGFQRPTDEPATAEEALLQPGAHRRRAGAVGRKPPQQI